jgi:hypothetical protein
MTSASWSKAEVAAGLFHIRLLDFGDSASSWSLNDQTHI